MKHCAVVLLLWLVGGSSLAQTGESGLPPGESPPPTVFDLIADAGDSEKYDEAAYVVVADSSVSRVNDLGVTYTDSYMLFKILTEEGCAERSVISERYEPMSSWVEVREVNVIRGDSAIPVPTEDVLDLPAPQYAIYWGDRVKMLQLPRLHVGDGIEIKLFRKGYSYALLDNASTPPDDEKYIPPMPGEYFDIVLFETTVPILRKTYVLKLPANKRLHSRTYNRPIYSSTTYNGDTTTYAWWLEDIPAWKPEPSRAGSSDFLAKVVLATVESWEAKSRWFFEINEPQFAFTDAIKAKVDEILADAGVSSGTDQEKAFELVHWVAQNIRYSGQTMGEGEGYTLHPGSMIFEQRSGVCKDIAGMLITMMRAAGLDSYGAMTMAGSRIEEVPADQFNHCVVALRLADGRFEMYDPTWVPNNKDIWSRYETEQHYLIGTGEGDSLSRIPYSPPEESPMHVTHTARILEDGSLEGTLEFRGEGSMDGRLRGMLIYYPRSELKSTLERTLSVMHGRIQLVSYQHGELVDFHSPMWWKLEYRIPSYALPVDGGLEFRSPLMQLTTRSRTLFRPGTVEWPEERHDDVFFYTTQWLDGHETIKLPRGFSVDDPADSDAIDETYASFEGRAEADNNELTITQDVKIKRRQIPPDGYDGFRRAVEEAREYAETVFRAEKGGDR